MVTQTEEKLKKMEQGWTKGPWTPEEDRLLSQYVEVHGEGRWTSVAIGSGELLLFQFELIRAWFMVNTFLKLKVRSSQKKILDFV